MSTIALFTFLVYSKMATTVGDMCQLARSLLFNASGYAELFFGVLLIGYLLSFSERYIYLFTVLPGSVLPPNCWIWTCASHSVIENHWWIVVWDIVAISVQSKLLGPLWGRVETVKFYVLVTLLVALLTTFTYIGLYLITQNTDYLFDNYVNGLAGYLAGISVSVKQIMPEHVIVSVWSQKLRNNHLPLLLLILALCLRLFGIVEEPYPLMFSWGLLVSWVYLRFYQKHSNASRGDTAEHFSFARSVKQVSLLPSLLNCICIKQKQLCCFTEKIKS